MGPIPIIRVEKLARRYGRRWALADVSFNVQPGSVVMVAGRNGSGKSTLFRILATAIRPHGGHAHVAGFDVAREREDVRKVTALLSHSSYLYEALTARENLRLVAEHMGSGRDEILPLLERVELAQRADDPVSTYSAGMRKRLSFARVLLQNPKVALFDEPYGALDPEGFVLVDDVVRELKARGATVLIATHQVEHVSNYADEMIVLNGGRVVKAATSEELAC